MRKVFISIVCSLMIFFVIWRFIICVRNNWQVQNIRFSLIRTFKQVESLNNANFEDLLSNIKTAFDSYSIYSKSINLQYGSFLGGFSDSILFLGLIGTTLGYILEYISSMFQLVFEFLYIIFNPITY